MTSIEARKETVSGIELTHLIVTVGGVSISLKLTKEVTAPYIARALRLLADHVEADHVENDPPR